jgi:hypothetical protein
MSTAAPSATYNAVTDGGARLGERLNEMMSRGSLGAMQKRALRIKQRTEGLWSTKAADLAVAVSSQAQARPASGSRVVSRAHGAGGGARCSDMMAC